ncbi:MAG: cupin [Burkholderiales bacterium]
MSGGPDPGGPARERGPNGFDCVVVPLTDGLLGLETGDGVAHFELKAGRSYARRAGVEHDVVNAGTAELAFVEIEYKTT